MSILEYMDLKNNNSWGDFFSSNRNFFQINDKLHFLKNIYVTGEHAFLVDEELNLIDSLLYETYYWSPRCFDQEYGNIYDDVELLKGALSQRRIYLNSIKDEIFSRSNDEEILRIKEAIYLLHPFGWYAFGHLNDSLLRLKSIEALGLIKDIPILVSESNRIVDFKIHLSVILGFEPKLIEVTKQQKVFIENLVVPVNNSIYTSFIKNDYIWLREKYLEYFCVRENQHRTYKLYLSRNHVTEGGRSVINEVEVEQLLHANGFITLRGTESLEEIVNYFYHAKTIIGYHGSLFANLIFSKKDCRVLEFCAKNREDHSFQLKYKIINNYQYTLVDADEKFNATLDLDIISEFLLKENLV